MTLKHKYKLTFLGKVVIWTMCALIFVIFTCTIGYMKYYQKKNTVSKTNSVKQAEKKAADSTLEKPEANIPNNTDALSNSGNDDKLKSADNTSQINKLIGTVYFGSNEADIRQENYELIDNIIKGINQYKNAFIEVQGNTADASDTLDKGNSQLDEIMSYERAKAVASYMKAKGVDMSKVILIANGSKAPVDDNSTEDGRKNNRRVEVHVVTN